jgi:hypothetical protein
MPVICFYRVYKKDSFIESVILSTSNSSTILRESSSCETLLRSLLAARISLIKPPTDRDVLVIVKTRVI